MLNLGCGYMRIDYQLIKCAFGKHRLSEHINDSYHGWIKICKKCGYIHKLSLYELIKK